MECFWKMKFYSKGDDWDIFSITICISLIFVFVYFISCFFYNFYSFYSEKQELQKIKTECENAGGVYNPYILHTQRKHCLVNDTQFAIDKISTSFLKSKWKIIWK